jgi:hypothetical protein
VALLGLTTYRQDNNIKSTVLLLLFPVLLLTLLGFIFFFAGLSTDPREFFYSFDIDSVLGTGTPFDLALSAVYAYWPIIIGIAAAWVLIGYLFNDWIIHRATGAQPATRQ